MINMSNATTKMLGYNINSLVFTKTYIFLHNIIEI